MSFGSQGNNSNVGMFNTRCVGSEIEHGERFAAGSADMLGKQPRAQPLPHPDTLSFNNSSTGFLPSDPSSLSAASPPGTSKRPRAGTLPSTFHLGPPGSGSSSSSKSNGTPTSNAINGLDNTANSAYLSSASGFNNPARPDALHRRLSGLPLNHHSGSSLSNDGPAGGLTPPTATHKTASAADLDSLRNASASELRASLLRNSQPVSPDPVAAARLRSGSLTLPPSGLGNAFTPGVFGPPGSWTPRSTGLGTPRTNPTSLSIEDSMSSSSESIPVSPTEDPEANPSIGGILNFLNIDDNASNISSMNSSSLADASRTHPQTSPTSAKKNGLLAASSANRASGSLSVPSSTHPSIQNLQQLYNDHSQDYGHTNAMLQSHSQDAIATALSGPSLSPVLASRFRSNTVGAPDLLLRRSSPSRLSNDGQLDNGHGQRFLAKSGSSTPLRSLADLSLEEPPSNLFGNPSIGIDASGLSAQSSAYLLNSLHRPRASTIGILDNSISQPQNRKRAGTSIGTGFASTKTRTPLYEGSSDGYLGARHMPEAEEEYDELEGGLNPWSSRSARVSPVDSLHTLEGYPYHHQSGASSGYAGTNRSNTPPPHQASRSLWIGNIDARMTVADLYTAFGIYGAIESVRLLGEKECAFVNYMTVQDAVKAKEDVLNRLGGQVLTSADGPVLVRIGFGKAESAPPTPATGLQGRLGASGAALTTPTSAGVLGDQSQLQTSPTRALWIGSIPANTTNSDLLKVFAPYGPIESARVLMHKQCGFCNFENLDDAVRARGALNGKEILGAEVGPVKIGFAKVPSKSGISAAGDENVSPVTAYASLARLGGATAVPLEEQISSGNLENFRSPMALSLAANGLNGIGPYSAVGLQQSLQPSVGLAPSVVATEFADAVATTPGIPMPSVSEQQILMRELSGDPEDADANAPIVVDPKAVPSYYATIPAAVEEHQHVRMRNLDAPRLRDIRKRLEAPFPQISQIEIDTLTGELMEDIVPLASDYIGNVIVQKLFEKCSSSLRLSMLERLAPYLASIACHKNGTWAAQKIIDTVSTPPEIGLICVSLRPYVPPLLLDQYGNYAAQLCLRFFSPLSDFLFDAMVDRCWEIASGRFGARSMRTCLEASNASRLQQKRVAIAVILNSVLLATNPNGALLLTWLLDTSNLPGRYRLLATRLIPHLGALCTHKVASTTILKLINQKADASSSQSVVDAILRGPDDSVLEEILAEQIHGSSFMHKLLSSSHISPATREVGVEKVKHVLQKGNPHHSPTYAKLCHEVGLAAPLSAPGVPSPHTSAGSKPHRDGPQMPYIHTGPGLGAGPGAPVNPMSPPFSFPSFGSPLSPQPRAIPNSNSPSFGNAPRDSSSPEAHQQNISGHYANPYNSYNPSFGLGSTLHHRASPTDGSSRHPPMMPGLAASSQQSSAYADQYLRNVAALQMSGFGGYGSFSPQQTNMMQSPYNNSNSPYLRTGHSPAYRGTSMQ